MPLITGADSFTCQFERNSLKKSLLYLIIFYICIPADLTFGAEAKCIEGECIIHHENITFIADFAFVEESNAWEKQTLATEENKDIGHIILSSNDTFKEKRGGTIIPTQEKPATEYIRGNLRSLQVPFIEPSPLKIEGIETEEMPLQEPSIELPDEIKEQIVTDDMPPTLIVVDGLLNDALWDKAKVSGDFWASLENKPATDKTEVLVAQDNNYLYFAFRLYDSKPEEIQATKTVRDVGFGYDDSITVELDTFFNRRDISEFSLNPLGTQNDDIAGGRSAKIEWKGDWLGAAARTDYGWSAEFAIPFAILNYQQDSTIFGINFKRYQSRTKEYIWWADVTPKNLPEEMGQLQGLKLPSIAASERKSWTFMPYVLGGKNIPDKEGEIQDSLFTGGIDIRYQPRPDLTGVLSLNPDFSQVETAVTDISFSYTEKAVDDNRPFFVEGGRYFSDSDDEYFYSNRVADFNFGGKGFGRFGNTKFGVLATSAPDDRYDAVGRLLQELNDTHSAIATLTATHQNTFDNALAVAQFKGSRTQTSTVEYALDAAITDTSDVQESDIPEGQGTHFKGMLGWKSDYWYLKTNLDKYDVDYFPALALLDDDLPGTWAGSYTGGYYREQSEHFWRVIDSYAGFKYRETDDNQLQERKWFFGGSVEFEKQIRTSIYLEEGPYRPVTDVRGVFEDYTNQDRYYSTAVDFNTRSSVYSFGVQYDWGQLGGGDYNYIAGYAWWRPIQQVYLNLTSERTDSFGIYKQTVLVGSWEITPEDSIGARYIFYDSDDGKDEYFRVAYGRKARKGLDIFAVYDKGPSNDAEYSLKLVYTF